MKTLIVFLPYTKHFHETKQFSGLKNYIIVYSFIASGACVHPCNNKGMNWAFILSTEESKGKREKKPELQIDVNLYRTRLC